MKGFFEKEETGTLYKSEKGMFSCVSCGLYKNAHTPKMKPYGEFKKKIMIIGESVSENDDIKGIPWQDSAGRLLRHQYKKLGVDVLEDCISLHAVNCQINDPTEYQISCCRQKVLSAVKQYQPKVIILHGISAVSSLIGHKWKKDMGGVIKWRGWHIPDRDYQAWVCPTFDPSFVMSQDEENEVSVIWDNDLRQAFEKVETDFPKDTNEEESIVILDDAEEILKKLNKETPDLLAFDIETTGLKPYDKNNHKIVTISFCDSWDSAYAVPFPEDKRNIKRLKKLLENPNIGKIAANMKYEATWMKILHGIEVFPWSFDTMLAAHILDNRPKITGLKFQAYVQFGILGYEDYVNSYLKSPDSNTPNRIMELTRNKDALKKLFIYNGMDSLLEYRLAVKQMRQLGMN